MRDMMQIAAQGEASPCPKKCTIDSGLFFYDDVDHIVVLDDLAGYSFLELHDDFDARARSDGLGFREWRLKIGHVELASVVRDSEFCIRE